MMSVWHLVWIVPVSGMLGFFYAAVLAAAKGGDR